MSTATITSRGRITIPRQVREAIGLDSGDQVVFVIEDGKAYLHPVHRRGLERLRGIARGRAPFPGREAEREAARSLVVRHVVADSQE
ncbi:MAG: AbrB/MazE/SpoVT family DNA-binding domain-containing protein [Chloroflexi bacterium]|nr:AbrB/MazE/SpoVT family DNA-binding domain-containing protein [Chloroflexota bacterium]